MNFEFVIINSDRFRNFKKYRYALYIVLLTLYFLIFKVRSRRLVKISEPFSASDKLGLNAEYIWYIFIFLAIITILFYFYTKKYKVIGSFIINSNQILCEVLSEKHIFLFSEIHTLQLNRNSTWHYSYQHDNYLVKTNNWIDIETANGKYNYEFLIQSEHQNAEFEKMVGFLRQNINSFEYKSI